MVRGLSFCVLCSPVLSCAPCGLAHSCLQTEEGGALPAITSVTAPASVAVSAAGGGGSAATTVAATVAAGGVTAAPTDAPKSRRVLEYEQRVHSNSYDVDAWTELLRLASGHDSLCRTYESFLQVFPTAVSGLSGHWAERPSRWWSRVPPAIFVLDGSEGTAAYSRVCPPPSFVWACTTTCHAPTNVCPVPPTGLAGSVLEEVRQRVRRCRGPGSGRRRHWTRNPGGCRCWAMAVDLSRHVCVCACCRGGGVCSVACREPPDDASWYFRLFC